MGNFLVNYLDLQASKELQLQLLNTLSGILNFTEEERIKIGAKKAELEGKQEDKKKPGTKAEEDKVAEAEEDQGKKKISDKFMDFLMGSDEE